MQVQGLAPAPTFRGAAIRELTLDGVGDDLLTGGLGADGLASPIAPAPADPACPTPAELRRMAIYHNYRSLSPTTAAAGYGTQFAPCKVAGREYHVSLKNEALMVQVPDNFRSDPPCIVVTASSGSRGVYGTAATTAEWALARGCVLACTDGGRGPGLEDLDRGLVIDHDGRAVPREEARNPAFLAQLCKWVEQPHGWVQQAMDSHERQAYLAQNPHRVAFKHAHSQQDPEREWGRDVLDAVELAFQVLNARGDGRVYTPENTVVIAASVSNGGEAVLAAGEQDRRGLLDGVVAAEPNASTGPVEAEIACGDRPLVTEVGRSLLDLVTLSNLYGPCAALLAGQGDRAQAEARCASLADKGLLRPGTFEQQALEARSKLEQAGLLPEAESTRAGLAGSGFYAGAAVAYANSYGRFSPSLHLAGYSFGATLPARHDERGRLLNPQEAGRPTPFQGMATLAGVSSGLYPGAGISLINDLSPDGPRENQLSRSPSTGRLDGNLDGALRLRSLFEGRDLETGQPLQGLLAQEHRRIQEGIEATRMTGDQHGKPTLVLVPRNDQIIAPNHAGRAYFAKNQLVEGADSQARLIEIPNAHHLDALNDRPDYAGRYVNVKVYFHQALDRMYEHLTRGTPLPESQVVRSASLATLARPEDRITFSGRRLTLPE